jgi:homoserine O-succinyltransferase
MLGRTNALCDVTFVVPDNYGGKNSAPGYLDNFYKRFSEIKGQQFDGVIVTGAPIEHLPFEEVKYWGELQAFLDSVKEMDAGMLSLCWGAMATLWHFHQVPKHMTDRKQFGVFAHRISDAAHALVQAIPDGVGIPVSRHTTWRAADVAKAGGGLAVLLDQSETGPGLVWDAALGHAHMINHFEYDRLTLDSEYRRDVAKGTPTGDAIHVPPNYYTGNDPGRDPIFAWKAAGQVLYSPMIGDSPSPYAAPHR